MRRASMSVGPPGAYGTITRTGRAGYDCARALRENADSAAVPAARCRNCLRGSFILHLPLASHHSITSSARKSVAVGTLRPSAVAVLRFRTVSNLLGSKTGKSDG